MHTLFSLLMVLATFTKGFYLSCLWVQPQFERDFESHTISLSRARAMVQGACLPLRPRALRGRNREDKTVFCPVGPHLILILELSVLTTHHVAP